MIPKLVAILTKFIVQQVKIVGKIVGSRFESDYCYNVDKHAEQRRLREAFL